MTFQERAKDAIRESGGRITPQRKLLLHLLESARQAIDADTLYQLAMEADPNLSLPTVYRTLRVLEDAHVIRSQYVSTVHERKVYRLSENKQALHFTCSQCGTVVTFETDLIPTLIDNLSRHLNVDVMTLCMCAGGLCADCREEQA